MRFGRLWEDSLHDSVLWSSVGTVSQLYTTHMFFGIGIVGLSVRHSV